MRFLAALTALLLPLTAFADEVDLARDRRGSNTPPELVIKAEGGSTFAPYGYLGGAVNWMLGSNFEVEGGAGAGIPGLQLGLAVRTVIPFSEDGKYLLAELSLAGNTKVNRGGNSAPVAGTNIAGQSSLWTGLGIGGELRRDFYSLDLVAQIVFTTQDLSPFFCVHGGIGFGIF